MFSNRTLLRWFKRLFSCQSHSCHTAILPTVRLPSRSPHQDCLSNVSNCQSKQDLVVQHHQLFKQVKHYKSFVTSILLYSCETWTRAQDQRLGAEQDQLPCESTGTSSGNCHETKPCMVQACHMPLQPLQNHPSGHTGGWATPWSAEEMLDGQHQRVDTSAHARTAHKGLLQKILEEDIC